MVEGDIRNLASRKPSSGRCAKQFGLALGSNVRSESKCAMPWQEYDRVLNFMALRSFTGYGPMRTEAKAEAMGRVNVWIVSELYYPEDTSTGYYVTEIAEGLATSFVVGVLCGQPSYAWRGTDAPRKEVRKGVTITRCRAVVRISRRQVAGERCPETRKCHPIHICRQQRAAGKSTPALA